MEDDLSPDKAKAADLEDLDTEEAEAEAEEFYSEEAEADGPAEPALD